MNSFLRYGILTGVFAIPFVAFIVSSTMFFPFITGKNFTFRIITEIIFALWVILALRDQAFRPKFSYIFASFAVLVSIMAIADIFGENPSRSFWSNYERMDGLITLIHLFAYFVVLGSVVNSGKLWRALFNTNLFGSFLMCIYSFVQLGGGLVINQGGVRVDGTLGNATYLAIYMVFNIFLAILLMARRDTSTLMRSIYGALLICQLIVLYHTATRGAILGLIGGLGLTALIIALFHKEKDKNNLGLRKIAIGGVVSLVVIVGGFILAKNTSFVQDSEVLSRFASISLNETKTQARAYVWPMAIAGFKERPILGWGQENFNYVFNKYYNPAMFAHEPWFDRTHNVFLDWLIAGGILGLLSYLSLYVFALFAIWRHGDLTFPERAIITGLFAAYMFHNIFVFDNIVSYLLFVLFLAYLHFDVARSFKERVSNIFAPLYRNQGVANRVIAPLIIILICYSIYFFNAKPIAANTALISSITNNSVISAEDRINLFKKAISYNTLANQEAREQLIQVAFNMRNAQNIELKDRQAFYDYAKSEYEKMIVETPNDVRHRLFMGMLLNMYGEFGDALKQLQKALELSPKKQAILFEISNLHVNSGNYEEGLKAAKEAFDLAPNYESARIIYAVTAIYAGRNDIANKLLMEGFGTIAYPDDRLARAYFDTGQFNRIVEIWQMKVKQNPMDSRAHSALAIAYVKVGRISEGIAELIKARDLETDASLKAEYDAAINDLRAGRDIFR